MNAELATIKDVVKANAFIGHIRMQWWRDAVDEVSAPPSRDGLVGWLTGACGRRQLSRQVQPREHPVVVALAHAMRQSRIERMWLDRIIDARVRNRPSGPRRWR